MTTYRNTGTDQVIFRDDSPAKRFIDPGQTFTLIGDQHAVHVETLAGVKVAPDPEPLSADATMADLRDAADRLGIPIPANARKADLQAAVTNVTGLAPVDDDGTTD